MAEVTEVTRFHLLPWDIQAAIMSNLDGLKTLQRFLIAFPELKNPFLSYFKTITRNILDRTLPDLELRRFLFAIIAARCWPPHGPAQIQSFFDSHFGPGASSAPLAPDSSFRDTSLEYMIHVLEAVEFYRSYAGRVWTSTRAIHSPLFCKRDPPVNYTPASDSWSDPPSALRMRRAMMRIQLYTEIFHQPGDSSLSNTPDDWETRAADITVFWSQFDFVEMRECKCIYAAIALSVGHETHYKHLTPVQKDHQDTLHLRGLPQLQRFMQGKPYTKFGMWYLNRLLEKKMHGFNQIDPRDDIRDYHMIMYRIFGWEDGPHGGLGQVSRRREYVDRRYFVDTPFYHLFESVEVESEEEHLPRPPFAFNRLTPLPGQSW